MFGCYPYPKINMKKLRKELEEKLILKTDRNDISNYCVGRFTRLKKYFTNIYIDEVDIYDLQGLLKKIPPEDYLLTKKFFIHMKQYTKHIDYHAFSRHYCNY